MYSLRKGDWVSKWIFWEVGGKFKECDMRVKIVLRRRKRLKSYIFLRVKYDDK